MGLRHWVPSQPMLPASAARRISRLKWVRDIMKRSTISLVEIGPMP